MNLETKTAVDCSLQKATRELQTVSRITGDEIVSVARTFEGLAGHTDTMLELAAAIVGCVEDESVSSVLPKVQYLGSEAKSFIASRLQATAEILEAVTTEVKLLRQLSEVTRGQAGIALETRALSVLTNIEVGRLGTVGADFHYLAQELVDFSKTVSRDTQELAGHTDSRRAAIQETKRVLEGDLPHMREGLARIESDLGNALLSVESSLTQLSSTPVHFRNCVSEVAQQITGVVAAVQAHDITRQQIDHVQESFALISARVSGAGNSGNEGTQELARAYAGVRIQIYQLRSIRETIAAWATQIKNCMGVILTVSTSEVIGIGPVVLVQERELSSQLAHIDRLERESHAYSKRIQGTLGGLSNLMLLVREHLQRSKSIRDHLQLLTFNSIIEASRLGTQAAAILAIAQSIKGVSAEWSEITDRSGRTMLEVVELVKRTDKLMEAFSEASNERLREAQTHTTAGLKSLRTAAEFAAGRAQEMTIATEQMQAKTTEVGNNVERLDACSGHIDAVLNELEMVKRQLEVECPGVNETYDAGEVEQLFSSSYTTEMERQVLRAALAGEPLPAAQQTFEGNSVELF